MNLTIRNLPLAFTKLIILSIIALVSPASGERAKNSEPVDAGNIRLYTVTNTCFIPRNSTNYFIVLRNSRNCHQCFTALNDYVKEARKKLPLRFLSVSLSDSSTLERKRNIAAASNLMPDLDEHMVQYQSGKENFFIKYQTDYTPEIIIICRGKIYHIAYREIFDYGSMNVLPAIQGKILEILNE